MKDTSTPKHTAEEHSRKITIGRVVEHLDSHSIKGVIPRQDIQSLIDLTNELLEQLSKLKDERKWISVDSMPLETYVLIHTKTGRVRVAKKVSYKNGSQAITYASIYFKDVTHWQSLPEVPSTP